MNAGRSAAVNTNNNLTMSRSRIAFRVSRRSYSCILLFFFALHSSHTHMFVGHAHEQDVSNRVKQGGASKLGKGKQKRTVRTEHSAAVAAKKKTSLPKTVDGSSGGGVKTSINRAYPRSSEPKLPPPSKCTNNAASTRARDIDARDKDDPLMATDYVQDMFQYFREQESRAIASPYLFEDDNHDAIQPKINQRMRAILVDWLVDIHHKMKCDPTVLYLTVQILDRFLAADANKASKKNLQLIGTSAFLIAGKYEQIYPAPISDLVYVCDRIYTEDDVSTCA